MTAYLSYLAGDVFGLSGILALFVCAVAISHYALNNISGGCCSGCFQRQQCHRPCSLPNAQVQMMGICSPAYVFHSWCSPPPLSARSRVAHHHHLRFPHAQLRVGGRHLCVLRPGCPGPAQVAGGREQSLAGGLVHGQARQHVQQGVRVPSKLPGIPAFLLAYFATRVLQHWAPDGSRCLQGWASGVAAHPHRFNRSAEHRGRRGGLDVLDPADPAAGLPRRVCGEWQAQVLLLRGRWPMHPMHAAPVRTCRPGACLLISLCPARCPCADPRHAGPQPLQRQQADDAGDGDHLVGGPYARRRLRWAGRAGMSRWQGQGSLERISKTEPELASSCASIKLQAPGIFYLLQAVTLNSVSNLSCAGVLLLRPAWHD